ncbi:MAG: hypothetical protein AAFR66_19800 [Bacteroidota bacterium]
MRVFLLAIFLLGLISCEPEVNNGVYLYNDISFKLQENESVEDSGREIIAEYEKYRFPSDLQIPLFKCIKGDQYTIFLGIPYETSVEEIADAQRLVQDPLLFEFGSNSPLLIRNHVNGTYSTEFLVPLEENLFYVLATSTSQPLLDSILTQEILTNRFVSSATHKP